MTVADSAVLREASDPLAYRPIGRPQDAPRPRVVVGAGATGAARGEITKEPGDVFLLSPGRAVASARVSIIVPVADAAGVLRRTLPALRTAADALRGELIVVDDASADASLAVAAEWADVLVRLPGEGRGPAYARNRGAEVASGETLVFVDADVLVDAAVVRGLVELLEGDGGWSAAFGSFDDGPSDAGFVCRYRNLLAHELHETMAGETDIFWASCGAVRREAFAAVGGFDEWRFVAPEVESVELGHRLSQRGFRIVLRPELQVTHLRRYSLRSLVIGDLRQFVVPLYRVRHDGGLPRIQFPVRIEKRASLLVALGLLSLAAVPVLPGYRAALLALGVVLPLAAVLVRWRLYAYFARHAGLAFALAVIPLHQAHAAATATAALLGKILGSLFGEPRPDALTEAFAEVGVMKWPPYPRRPA